MTHCDAVIMNKEWLAGGLLYLCNNLTEETVSAMLLTYKFYGLAADR